MKNYMEMRFSASLKNVIFARGAVASFLLEQDLRLNVINEIKTIVSEAVTNAIVHGYRNNPDEMVFLSLLLENNKLTITISDTGVGIEDIEKAKEPLFSTREEEERAGLGFTIMDIFSDSLDIWSEVGKGTTIISSKIFD
ncbi:MAG: anti-sigma F factor [Acholeplasmataceae bacterium]|nr:anti-sigma F factor [Acholeplasmataceae bacterium]